MQIQLRLPHANALERVAVKFQEKLAKQTGNDTAPFTASNLLEMLIEEVLPEYDETLEKELASEVTIKKALGV